MPVAPLSQRLREAAIAAGRFPGNSQDAGLHAPEVAVSRADIEKWPTAVGRRRAHDWLREWRAEWHHFDHQALSTDKLDGVGCRVKKFDWMGYVKNHIHKEIIIPDNGCKIVMFAIGKYPAMDTNTKDMRVDFAVYRDDGKVIRLHPSSKQEARPLIVEVGQTRFTVNRIRGGSQAGSREEGEKGKVLYYEVASDSEILSARQVLKWLWERTRLWPGTMFTQDIKRLETLPPRDMCMPWQLFFAGVPCLQPLISQVSKIYTAWLGGKHNKPCLWVELEDGGEFVIDLGDGRARTVTIREDLLDSICWWQ